MYTIPCARCRRKDPQLSVSSETSGFEEMSAIATSAPSRASVSVSTTEPARAAGDEHDAARKVDLERHRAILRC